MALPTFKVEVAFTTQPLTAPGAWTDITAYVRRISTHRGRTHELSQSQSGDCTIYLRNTDRRFDPLFATGPYYGNLLPMRQIRVTATHNAVTYPIFYGYIENWSQTWPGRPISAVGDAECVVHARDGFKLLALYQFANTYSAEVEADKPDAYYRLDEPSFFGTTVGQVFVSGIGGSAPINMTYNLLGVPGPLIGGATAYRASYATGLVPSYPVFIQAPGAAAGDSPTMEAWVYIEGLPVGNAILMGNGNFALGSYGSMLIYVDATGQFSTYWGDLGTGPSQTDLTWTIPTGVWTHIAFTHTGSNGGYIQFYRNGIPVGPPVYAGTHNPTFDRGTVFNIGGGQSAAEQPFARFAHVAAYNYPLSPERIAAHYAASLGGIAAGLAGTQIGVLLDQMGWPAGLRALDAGTLTMQTFDPVGSTLEHLLKICEDSEQGLLQMSADGKITFHDRASVNAVSGSHGVSQATFGDAGAELAYADLELRYDDADLYTRVVATRDGGGPQLASDAAAIAAYGPRTLTRSTPRLATDADVSSAANYLLAAYKAPAVRPVSVSMKLANSVTMNAAVLGRDTHHDRVTIVRRPQGGGAAISFDAHVEGISYDIVGGKPWDVKFDLVPIVNFWLLQDAVLGLLGQTTFLGS